jgi:hypothetical protein
MRDDGGGGDEDYDEDEEGEWEDQLPFTEADMLWVVIRSL